VKDVWVFYFVSDKKSSRNSPSFGTSHVLIIYAPLSMTLFFVLCTGTKKSLRNSSAPSYVEVESSRRGNRRNVEVESSTRETGESDIPGMPVPVREYQMSRGKEPRNSQKAFLFVCTRTVHCSISLRVLRYYTRTFPDTLYSTVVRLRVESSTRETEEVWRKSNGVASGLEPG
jgi:hypothetical protein